MSIRRKIKYRTIRRAQRVRNRFSGEFPRVTVFRSLKQIYAQAIDDNAQKTITSFSSLNLKDTGKSKSKVAHTIGLKLAEELVEKGIKKIVFDRGPFLYHGRVKSLAEGLREGGLEF